MKNNSNKIILKKVFISLLVFIILSGIGFFGVAFFLLNSPVIDLSSLENYNPGKPSILLDINGIEWGRFQADRRELITFDKIPKKLVNAFIATEDRNFFNHNGISFKGIIRSVIVNIIRGKYVQGASTITQQIVRLLFLNSNKNVIRKFKEQLVALLVEKQFSKEYILQTYLNHVYFGSGIYGVQSACQRFWGKNVSDISVSQAAILAGIVKSPTYYCPIYNSSNILERRNMILNLMLNLKFISQEDYRLALLEPIIDEKVLSLNLSGFENNIAPHLKETIRVYLENLYGKKRLYSGGLIIGTTLDLNLQEKAQKIFHDYLNRFKADINKDIDGSFISIDVQTGEIRVIIGGYDFNKSNFNRAFNARRQIGSIFKPLIYAQAIMSGRTLKDTEFDEPLSFEDNSTIWSPRNHYRSFSGQMTLAYALSISNNIIPIKLFLSCNPYSTLDLAKKCKLPVPLYPYPSLALGCLDSSLDNVTGMMNIFANNGKYVEPYFIRWIKDEWGAKIFKHKRKEQILLPPRVAGEVAKVLTLLIDRAKVREPKKWFKFDALGKTGTTNDVRTCWFSGSSPDLTSSVYIGLDNNNSLGKNIYSSQTAMQIWREFYKQIGSNKKGFIYDQSLKSVIIDKVTGEEKINEDASTITILVPR